MDFSFSSLVSSLKKNARFIVGLFTLLLLAWMILFAVPNLFVKLFDTLLGNLFLLGLVLLAFVYNPMVAVGLSILFVILYRFSHISAYRLS